MGKNGINLTDIKVNVGDDVVKTADGVKIQLLDELGFMTKTFTYHHKDSTKGYTTDGWYLGNKNIKVGDANDYFFTAGDGFWFGGKKEYSITTSGEVLRQSLPVDLIDGNKMIANPYPVAINLSEITVDVGDDVVKTADGVKIQILDELGFMVKTYTYHHKDTTKGYTTDGWYLGNKIIKATNDVTFAPGQAMWFGGKLGYKVILPAPKLLNSAE